VLACDCSELVGLFHLLGVVFVSVVGYRFPSAMNLREIH
jgi:hypothetical protein